MKMIPHGPPERPARRERKCSRGIVVVVLVSEEAVRRGV